MTPYEMRLGRLFDKCSGRAFIVAFDRGLAASIVPAGTDALGIVETISGSEADGVILSPGLAARSLNHFAHRQAPRLLVRSDLLVMDGAFPTGLVGSAEEYRLLVQPEEASALGADAIVLFLVLGYQNDSMTAENAAVVAETVQKAHAVGLPVMVETVLWGTRVIDQHNPDQLAFACRLCAELGADIIKTQYTGDAHTMRDIIASVPVPVMALGGPRTDSDDSLTSRTREILDSGTSGVVYGRTIWQADDPAAAVQTVSGVVHDHLNAM